MEQLSFTFETIDQLRKRRDELLKSLRKSSDFECPKCRAKPGKDCKNKYGGDHLERRYAEEKANAEQRREISSLISQIDKKQNEKYKQEEIDRRKKEEEQLIKREEELFDLLLEKLPLSFDDAKPSITLINIDDKYYRVIYAKNTAYPPVGKELSKALVEQLLAIKRIDIYFEDKWGTMPPMMHMYWKY